MRDRLLDPATLPLNPPDLLERGGGEVAAARGFRDGQLLAGRCADCGAAAWPPAANCHECLGSSIEELDLGSVGRLYAYSEIHAAPAGWRVPYVVGYIDMPQAVRVFAHLGPDAATLVLGGDVEVRPVAGHPTIAFRFEPVTSEA